MTQVQMINLYSKRPKYIYSYIYICMYISSDLFIWHIWLNICIGPITLAEFSAWHLFTLDYKWKKKINFIMVQLLFIIQGL